MKRKGKENEQLMTCSNTCGLFLILFYLGFIWLLKWLDVSLWLEL